MRFSNHLIGLVNFLTFLLSIVILGGGIWLSSRANNTDCLKFLQWPLIVIGASIMVVSLAGFAGACYRNTFLLWLYLFVMFFIIVALIGFIIFAYAVTDKGGGRPVTNKGYLEYYLSDYSGWLRDRVVDSQYWADISSCIRDSKVCPKMGRSFNGVPETSAMFSMRKLSPIQSGCCKPPTDCGYVYVNETDWDTSGGMIGRNCSKGAESGGFVLWQMNPDMWYVELAVGGSKVHAGCNGKLVWRHTPWLGAHSAKGPVRPLRRALQGLDPRTTASMFADARCIGEKRINGEDCFILKLCTDPQTLKARSEGPAEIIRHVLFGYFNQKTGLLMQMEDSHLTRIQSNGSDAVYWETTISSFLEDYSSVEGIMIAHSGRSVVTLFRFGEVAMSHTKTKMEEAWTIEEVAFNIPGLSVDCFIPPSDLKSVSISETIEFPPDERGKSAIALAAAHRALEKVQDGNADNMIRRMESLME